MSIPHGLSRFCLDWGCLMIPQTDGVIFERRLGNSMRMQGKMMGVSKCSFLLGMVKAGVSSPPTPLHFFSGG
jgi:hypothetical protein